MMWVVSCGYRCRLAPAHADDTREKRRAPTKRFFIELSSAIVA
jgi:hypothetical protein